MRKRLSGLRLAVLLLFMIGFWSPFVATGAAAQELTCDQFNSQRAAQAVLEADPELEESLDPDGDGIACNEGEPVDDPTEESTEEPTDDPTEEPTDDPTEEATDEPSGDEGAYLEDIQAEVDTVIESFDRQLEINTTIGDASSSEQQELVVELENLAETWADYPDVAAEFAAPAGLEDLEDTYLDFADLVGETGDTWLIWWDIPQGDPEEDPAFDEFATAIDGAYAAADDVTAAIEDAGGSTTPSDDPTEEPNEDPTEEATEEPTDDPTEEATEEPTDDPTEEATEAPSVDGEAYVEDVQSELDALTDDVDAFTAIFDRGADVTEDDAAELNDLAATWVEYPDVAFELVAPEGYEDIEDAYLDLADTVREAGELWEAYWAIPAANDDEEEIALDEFDTAFADVEDQIVGVQDLIDEVGGSTDPGNDDPTEEPTDDPTEEPLGDSDEYLTTVSDTAADWQDSIDRFGEILAQGGDITDAESTELGEIITAWISAPATAAELEAPAGLDDVQGAYEDYADELSNAGLAFTDWATAEVDSLEEDAALDDFTAALEEAQTLYTDLEDLLADAGA